MLFAVAAWRLFLRAAAAFYVPSAAALEAIFVFSQYNDILLRMALAFTNILSFYLLTMLRLNSFLGLTLAGVLFSREELEQQRRHSVCSTWASSRTDRNSCTLLCCGEQRPVTWLKPVLRAVPALCRCSRSVCMSILALSTYCCIFRPSGSTVRTLCAFIRPLLNLSILQTLTAYSALVLGIVWDLSSLISSP